MRPTRDEWAMAMVGVVARRATCLRRQVGCVLFDARGHVIATGYNGVAAGLPHCNDRNPLMVVNGVGCVHDTAPVAEFPNACPGANAPSGTNLDGCEAIHAEQNALLQCRDVHLIDTAYCTTSPCMTCIKLFLNSGCRRIVFAKEYAHNAAAEALWRRAGRDWLHHPYYEDV